MLRTNEVRLVHERNANKMIDGIPENDISEMKGSRLKVRAHAADTWMHSARSLFGGGAEVASSAIAEISIPFSFSFGNILETLLIIPRV